MILWLALTASGGEVAAFLDRPPPGAPLALGPAAIELERATGVPLTHWVRIDESAVPARARRVHPREPVPPPFERHDYDPPTPIFQGDWQRAAPQGMGVRKLWSWPGGGGLYSVLANVEYDYDPLHEDLRGNPPTTATSGEPLGEYSFHGNGSIGIAAAAMDGFGTSGAAHESTVLVVHPMVAGQWEPARAIADAAVLLGPGDVLLLEQQEFQDGAFAPLSVNPMVADAIEAATALGIVVVEPMGNGGREWVVDDVGSLRVGGQEPTTGAAHLSSNFGDAAHVSGWATSIVAPTTEEFSPDLYFPDEDSQQAYTSAFGGTSGASAQLAGLVTQLQSIAVAVHDAPLPVDVIREGLAETGVPQADGLYPVAERRVGPRPDAQAFARTFLVP